MRENIKKFDKFAFEKKDNDPYGEEIDENDIPQRPPLLEPSEASMRALRDMATQYVEERERNANGEVDDDLPHYMLEAVVQAFYGRGIFTYLRDRDNAWVEHDRAIRDNDFRNRMARRGYNPGS